MTIIASDDTPSMEEQFGELEPVAWAYYHDGQMDGPWHPVVSRTRWRHPVSEPWTEVPLFARAESQT